MPASFRSLSLHELSSISVHPPHHLMVCLTEHTLSAQKKWYRLSLDSCGGIELLSPDGLQKTRI